MTAGRIGWVSGLLFLIAWILLFPAEPWNVDADIYDYLSVARNLLEGDGLSNDLIYPMTTAFDWGRQLPQPLLHRPAGYPILLVPAVLATRGDPVRAQQTVRVLQFGFLILIVWAGLVGFQRRDVGFAGPAWLLLLFSPYLGAAVTRGWVEIPCALVLLVLWLRLREHNSSSAGLQRALVDGALIAGLTLLRNDLLWVPVLWWLAAVLLSPHRRQLGEFRFWRYPATACGVWLVLTLPWWIHVTLVAGSPFFNPMSYSLQLDLGTNWWNYPRLRGLEPESALSNLRHNFLPAVIKTRHGLRYFFETLGWWLPWSIWAGAVALWLNSRLRHRGHGVLRTDRPIVLLGVTLVGMALFYALISQEVRHLLVLLPVLAWEIVMMMAQLTSRWETHKRLGAPILAAVVGLAIVVAPPSMPAEQQRLEVKKRQAVRVEELAGEVDNWPPGPIFTDNAAVCWLTGRTGVWRPLNSDVEETIRETVPGMRAARWARLQAPRSE
ncbi:MAG: hypothetical protein KOO60_04880 [Gemmatimonadales bacterium]|nr:hypothetical protein [Gemmatimonadales bacterium]